MQELFIDRATARSSSLRKGKQAPSPALNASSTRGRSTDTHGDPLVGDLG